MSIKRNDTHFFPEYDAHCDGPGCRATLLGYCSFKEAAAARRANGWVSRKIGKGWKDLCPDCQQKGEVEHV
jgi:hypothetical protein